MGGPTHLSLCNRPLRGLVQFFHGLGIVTKIGFAANEDDGETWAEVQNLRDPLLMGSCQHVQSLHIQQSIVPSPGHCQESLESRRRSR